MGVRPPAQVAPARGMGAASMVGWLLTERALRFTISFVVGAAVARHLGVDDFGTLNRALAFAGLFGFLAGVGIDAILKRDLIAFPDARGELLATAFWMRVIASIISIVALTAMSWASLDNHQDRLITVIAGLPVLGSSFLVIDLDLQAQLEGRAVATCQFAGIVVSASWRLAMILGDAALGWFAAAAIVEVAVSAAALCGISHEGTLRTLFRRAHPAIARRFLCESWPLIVSGAAVGVYLRIDQVMLGWLRDSIDVGIYAAAVRVSELGNPVATIVAAALLPDLVRAQNAGMLEARARRGFAFSTSVAFVLALGGSAAAPFVVTWCFGRAYEASVPVLIVHVWSNVFVFVGVLRSQVLTARSAPRFLMISAAVGAIVNVGLNLWWIPIAGPVGAAWATLVAYAVAAWLSTLVWRPVRDVGLWQTRAILTPWRAFASIGR